MNHAQKIEQAAQLIAEVIAEHNIAVAAINEEEGEKVGNHSEYGVTKETVTAYIDHLAVEAIVLSKLKTIQPTLNK